MASKDAPESTKKEPEYIIDSVPLSKGDFCTVHKARRRCVLKEFDISQKDNSFEKFREKWLRDVEILINVRGHDGIGMYRDVFAQEGKIYIEMEYCDGGDLSHFICEKRPDSDVKHRFMTEMTCALAFLHSNNILHQNLQPNNVMVIYRSNGEPTIKLANFGLSKLIASTRFYGDLIGYFMLGETAGKYYLAPEIFSKHYGMFTDIYALGLLFAAVIIETTYEEKLAVYYTTNNGGVLSIGEFASENKCDFQICPAGFRGVYAVINMMLRYDYKSRPSSLEVENELRKTLAELYPPPPVSGPFLSPLLKKTSDNHIGNPRPRRKLTNTGTKTFWNKRIAQSKKYVTKP